MTRLHPADVEGIAERVADLVIDRLEPRRPHDLLTADDVAAYLGVDAAWVRDHAAKLQAIRLGSGPKARLRFRPELIEQFLAPEPATPKPTHRRRRAKAGADVIPLLPIRPIRGDSA